MQKERRTGQMAGTTLCVLYFGNLPPLEVMPMCGMVEKVQLAAILQALVALRRSLSTGLLIFLFQRGILHKNHKTFFFFFVNNPKASLASCTKATVFV